MDKIQKNPLNYYKELILSNEEKLAFTQKRIYLIGTLRLLIVLFTLAAIYLLWDKGATVIFSVFITGLAIFLTLMRIHNRYFINKAMQEAIRDICKKELRLFQYDFEGCDTGSEYTDSAHDYSNDLDIFGPKSIFSYIDRSATSIGRDKLAEMLKYPSSDIRNIHRKQQAIKELSRMNKLRLELLAQGMISEENRSNRYIIEEISDLKPAPALWLRIVSRYIPYIFIFLFATWLSGFIPGIVILYLFIACFLLAIFKSKKITRIQEQLNNGLKSLKSYAVLISQIESTDFSSSLLKDLKNKLETDGIPVSVRIKKLGKLLSNLDQRYNGIGFALLNGFLLWDFRQLSAIGEWLDKNASELKKWLQVLARFDALCSLATYTYNHPNYIFPSLNDSDSPVIRAREMGHPLINADRCVCNDISMESRPSFLVITGANMAGKSTYLRAIGVNFLLASAGAPVYAKEFIFSPCTLFTSLRTTDSLSDQESYFFAELKRLKTIVDRLHTGEKMFIILDEILKGTNSTDKQTGSLALIEQLIGLNASGVIATHDLMLGKLSNDHPGIIFNYRFEADITDNELSFSYRLQPGIAQNMNACFLMKKMGIIPESRSLQ